MDNILNNRIINFYLVLLICSFSSCSNSVKVERVGDYQLLGNYTSTIGGEKTINKPFRLMSNIEDFLNLCSDQPMLYDQFINDCADVSSLKERDLSELMLKHDLIVSKVPIKEVLKNTDFTKQDECGYLKREIVEIVLSNDEAVSKSNRLYVYRISPKNKYRLVLCP